MKIGIAGPVSTESIRKLLNDESQILPDGMGGAPFLGTLIESLLRNGHEVSVYTLDRNIDPIEKNIVMARGDNFKIYYGPYRRHSFKFNGGFRGRILDFFSRERQSILEAIEIDQPDIVHAHWSYEFGLAALDSKKPCLITCHDSPLRVLGFMPNLYRLGRLFMAKKVLKNARVISVVSPYLKDELKKWTRNDIHVIPNPAPYYAFVNGHEKLNWNKLDEPKIVMINNGWDKRKNVIPAIYAFNYLLKEYPKSTLHLFGHGYEKMGRAHQWVSKHCKNEQIIFHGIVENQQLLRNLQAASLFVHPALEECCPLTLIEAMSSGIPVVGGDASGGVPWVLDYGKAGVLTDIRKATMICNSMKTLLSDKDLYLSIRKGGMDRAQRIFTPEKVATEYEVLYEKILAQ